MFGRFFMSQLKFSKAKKSCGSQKNPKHVGVLIIRCGGVKISPKGRYY
jgi:hypothetical protein